ncbi:DUF1127 domain-containing protein [Poseidonocella sedimentorum]|uniref:YjiS-like domain-containing protein n=1 Tax=Poseidonocella sedimentorum TaxID=871652 RepID=A0A1I6DMW7_9RHOB|nr:DUF1127 domain-containing protein [Poseidonocella sedimentorum]SFR06779.1 protein of unknown function [Poseidonocella sedimentorum]
MAYAANAQNTLTFANFVSEPVAAVKAAFTRRAAYNRTYSELSALTDRDLNDLGISRSDIERIAREDAYGK